MDRERSLLLASNPVQIISKDPVLRDVLCRRIGCGAGPEVFADIILDNPSSDLMRNELLSLATLTTGLFITHSADVHYHIYREGAADWTGTVRVRDGLWFILPPYIGFLGTNLGTALNTYRDPVRLQHYCIREVPEGLRAFFDGDHSQICDDYEHFLEAFVQAIRPELQILLPSREESGAARTSP